jgi:hypothetical protein
VTADFMRALCRRGEAVRSVVLPGVNHIVAGQKAAATATGWLRDRFAQLPAPNDCATLAQVGAGPFSRPSNGIP